MPIPGDLRPYLIASERRIVEVRRHVMYLEPKIVQTVMMMVIAALIAGAGASEEFFYIFAWWIVVIAIVRLAWIMGGWWVERFIITDKRVMLTGGLITRKVAIMGIDKVTDMSYERTLMGQIFRYGTFIVESAGQDQALNKITHIPKPYQIYQQVSETLFGKPDIKPPQPLV